jgi:hypothetical protein
MANVSVNSAHLAEDISPEALEQGKEKARNILSHMNDRQFIDWLMERFPEASTGQVNIGIVTTGSVLLRFHYKDVADIIRTELVTRLGVPRLTKDMIGLSIRTPNGNRVSSMAFMKDAIEAFELVMKEGPEEPKVYFHDDMRGEIINKEWLDWYADVYGVTRTTAWKVAAAKIAKDYGKDLKEFTPIPGEHNHCEVKFVRSIDQLNLL